MNEIDIIKKEEITKKTVFLFKKFARKNKFWEEYKKLSLPLRKIRFVDLVEKCEPVQLIQSSTYFCKWPTPCTTLGNLWKNLSYNWAVICAENKLWYDRFISQSYSISFIRNSKGQKVTFD